MAYVSEDDSGVPYLKVKVCIVGDAGVGKTSLVRRYVFDTFDERRTRTLDVLVSTRGGFADLTGLGLTLSKRKDVLAGAKIPRVARFDLMIWDIVGSTRTRKSLHKEQFAHTKGLLAVCDATRGKSLDSLDDWIEEVYDVAGVVPTQIVANKIDVGGNLEIKQADLARAAWAFESPYLFTSAKTGENVGEAFQFLAARVLLDVLSKRLD